MQREVYDAMVLNKSSATSNTTDATAKKKDHGRTPTFMLDEERSKFLKRVEPPTDEPNGAQDSDPKALLRDGTPTRKSSGKWTAEEKKIFADTLEKHGQNWDLLAEAIPNKTKYQIKNHFYDTRKPKARSEKRRKRRGDDTATPPISSTPTPMDSVPGTPASEAVSLPLREEPSQPLADHAASFASLPYHSLRQQHALAGDAFSLSHQQEMDQLNSLPRSRASTPDPRELAWAQQQALHYQQSEEAARRLLHSHAQQQQLLNLRLAAQFHGLGGADWSDQQLLLQHLQQQQQHQQHHQQQHHHQQQQHSNLAAVLGLSSGYGGGVSDESHALAQLLSLQQGGGGGSSSEALNSYLRSLNNSGGGNPPPGQR